VSVPAPAATTENVACWPTATDWLAGCWVSAGGVPAFTVSVAGLLVALPAAFETTTVKMAPLSATVVAVVV
jgi:ABC-type xylose transport system permease subunit